MKRQKADKRAGQDRGAGYVTVVLDHATGGASIGYDNLLPAELLGLAALLMKQAQALALERARAEGREETRKVDDGAG